MPQHLWAVKIEFLACFMITAIYLSGPTRATLTELISHFGISLSEFIAETSAIEPFDAVQYLEHSTLKLFGRIL